MRNQDEVDIKIMNKKQFRGNELILSEPLEIFGRRWKGSGNASSLVNRQIPRVDS